MKRIFLTASVMALLSATPALAQGVSSQPAAPAGSEPTAPATPVPAGPDSTPPAPDSTAPMPAAPPAAQAPPASPEAASPMATPEAAPGAAAEPNMAPGAAQAPADWAKFDNGNKGYLDALDFGNWLMAKQGNDMSTQVQKTKTSKKSGLPAVKVLNATGSEFLKADKDGDRHITADELAGYVAG